MAGVLAQVSQHIVLQLLRITQLGKRLSMCLWSVAARWNVSQMPPKTITAGMKSVRWSHLWEGWKVGKQKGKRRRLWWCNVCVVERERRCEVDGAVERSSHIKRWILRPDPQPPLSYWCSPLWFWTTTDLFFQSGRTSVAFGLFCFVGVCVCLCLCKFSLDPLERFVICKRGDWFCVQIHRFMDLSLTGNVK